MQCLAEKTSMRGGQPRARHTLGRRAWLMRIKKTFQCRDISLVFLAPHLPLKIKYMTQADKWQTVYDIRLRDLLDDRRLVRLS
jgi:hypothetical protein